MYKRWLYGVVKPNQDDLWTDQAKRQHNDYVLISEIPPRIFSHQPRHNIHIFKHEAGV